MGPTGSVVEAGEGGHAEAAEDVVKQSVHLAMEREQRVGIIVAASLGPDRDREPGSLDAPGQGIRSDARSVGRECVGRIKTRCCTRNSKKNTTLYIDNKYRRD